MYDFIKSYRGNSELATVNTYTVHLTHTVHGHLHLFSNHDHDPCQTGLYSITAQSHPGPSGHEQ